MKHLIFITDLVSITNIKHNVFVTDSQSKSLLKAQNTSIKCMKFKNTNPARSVSN